MTFITEQGRFRYTRAPQGYGSSNDGYTQRTDTILNGCPGKPEIQDYDKIVDDIIQWSDIVEQAFNRICSILSNCSKAGMVFNPDKFQLAKEELQYAGYMVGNVNIRPTDSYLQAIRDFPAPQNISDMRSWYGLINQVAYSFCKTPVSEPFRKLLKPATPYIWTDELDKAFQDSKLKIISLVKEGVKLFVVDRHTCLSKDYSKSGIGWILQQKNCKCAKITPRCCEGGWDLILAGGRFNIPAETRYSPTEGEALAIAVALESSRYYTLGCPKLMVAADHKPLLGILSDRAFDSIDNPCLIRIKQKTLPWNFDLVYVPGKQHVAADGFSRCSQNAVFHILAEIASHGVRYKI